MLDFLSRQLHPQESQYFNCMFNNGEMLKIDIVLAIKIQTIKKGDQALSCVELVLKLVLNHPNGKI